MKTCKFLALICTILIYSCDTKTAVKESSINIDFSGVAITEITDASAQLSCNIKNNMQSLTSAGFCIGKNKDINYSNAPQKIEVTGAKIASSEPINIGCTVSSLEPSTQYFAKPYALIGTDVTYGQTISFRTLAVEHQGEVAVKKLPIVFHIIYENSSNPSQYISTSTIMNIVDRCNGMLRNTTDGAKGIDTKIELTLAQYDNNGVMMKEPGIDKIKSDKAEYDPDFFANYRKESISEMWDLSKYINIWIFAIPKDNIVGQSYLAYCTDSHPLGGLHKGDTYLYNTPTYAHGIYMSNKFIKNLTVFSQSLTHEIGHYLGLLHVFETKNENNCDVANDYCDDTNTYIRKEYEQTMIRGSYYRNDCLKSIRYEANNYMDYDYCFFTTFTPDQIARMQYVLRYSPLVPGAPQPKPTKAVYEKPKARLM
ncbi:MAG: M43 family zinc metalloprotease [Rikenellaceae bacterium]